MNRKKPKAIYTLSDKKLKASLENEFYPNLFFTTLRGVYNFVGPPRPPPPPHPQSQTHRVRSYRASAHGP